MRGLELRIDATPVVDQARERGLLVNRTEREGRPPAAAADDRRSRPRSRGRHPRRRPGRRSPRRCTHEHAARHRRFEAPVRPAIAAGVADVPARRRRVGSSAPACDADADAIHRLYREHLTKGTCCPRSREEIASPCRSVRRRASTTDASSAAPIWRRSAGGGGSAFARRRATARGRAASAGGSCDELERRALASGFETLCAFTHTPGYFVQLGFSIVPHMWLPEKIETDCRTCAQFRHCGQYAVMLPLIRTQHVARASDRSHG